MMQIYSGDGRPILKSTYSLQIVMIVKIDARSVAGRTNARTDGIVARTKVVSVKTSATVNRKRSVMV
jgi:NMD protein affecting ribosome stability and mRNA decay